MSETAQWAPPLEEQYRAARGKIAFAGILLYLITEYHNLSNTFAWFGALHVAKGVVIVTGLAFLLSGKATRLVWNRGHLAFLFFIGAMVLSLPFCYSWEAAQPVFIDYLKLLIIYLLIVHIVDTPRRYIWFTWLMMLILIKLSQYQIRTYWEELGIRGALGIIRLQQQGQGISGTAWFGDAADLGNAICVVLPIAMAWTRLAKHRLVRLFCLAAAIAFIVSIQYTGSRGAAAGGAATLIVYLVRGRNLRRKVAGMMIVGLVMGAFWYFAPEAQKSRFRGEGYYGRGGVDYTWEHRKKLWRAGMLMLRDHPFTGVGIGNYGPIYADVYAAKVNPRDIGRQVAPHNTYVQAFAELGILGVIGFPLAIILILKNSREVRRLVASGRIRGSPGPQFFDRMALAIQAGIMGWAVSSLFLTVLYYPHLYILMALSASLRIMAGRRAESDTGAVV